MPWLFLLPLIIAILSVFVPEGRVNKRTLSVFIVALLCYAILDFRKSQLNSDREAQVGTLNPPDLPGTMVFTVGPMHFQVESKSGVAFTDGQDPILRLKIRNGKLLVTAKFRDREGNPVAEISDNGWKTNPSNWDKNFTDNVLEVISDDKTVVAQIAHFGALVNIEGVFGCKDGGFAQVQSVQDLPIATIALRTRNERPKSSAYTLCDYPSDLHLHSCPRVERLRKRMFPSLSEKPISQPVMDICLFSHPTPHQTPTTSRLSND